MELRDKVFGIGLELEKKVRDSYVRTREVVEAQIKEQLKHRGLNLKMEDLSALVEDISPRASRLLNGYVLNYLRSISHTLGFRIAKLTDSYMEVVLPLQTHSSNSIHEMSEAALIGGATESCRILWNRRFEQESCELRFTKIQYRVLRPIHEDCRLRLEINEGQCQTLLLDLRNQQQGTTKSEVKVFDGHEQLLAEIELELSVRSRALLEGAS